MRGKQRKQVVLFTATMAETLAECNLDAGHPLRRIKARTDAVLASLHADLDTLYSTRGRPSIPPEYVLRALLWQALFSIRSERHLDETLRYDLRCRWFVGLGIDDAAWDHSTFSKLRESLLLERLAEMFFERHVEFLRAEGLVSDQHLSVDGTLLAAWASPKRLVRKDELDEDGRPPPSPPGDGPLQLAGRQPRYERNTGVLTPVENAQRRSLTADSGSSARDCARRGKPLFPLARGAQGVTEFNT